MRKIGSMILAVLMTVLVCCMGTAKVFAESSPQTNAVEVDDRAVSKEQVKAEFLHAWNGYKKYAWGHDELKPLSKGWYDWYREPLLITPVDAMVIMGLDQEREEAKKLIFSTLNFDKDISVQHFEISIRVLGGLLSAYQLDGDKRFLELATDLANRMLPVFDSKTGMPFRYVNLKTGKTSGALTGPAEIGTYLLEYGTLSKLTGNPVYYDKAKKAMVELDRRSSRIGLVGTLIDVNTGVWLVKDAAIGSGKDSYYEYLLKAAILFNDPELKAMWDKNIKAANTFLADESTGSLWYGHANMSSGKRTLTTFGALDAFFPALLALGGDIDRAARLEDSCYKMWTLQGIEPEILDYKNMKILVGTYPLRPEIIESAYYLYHYTSDEKYRRMGNVYFNSMVKYCRTDSGYANLIDVRSKKKSDTQPSYFLAETLKYFYLLFAPKTEFDFEKVIFTTEAHPMFKSLRKNP